VPLGVYMKILKLVLSVTVLSLGVSHVALSDQDKTKELPPGLQKKAAKGQGLPPGWQKKLDVGSVLDEEIYRKGKIITRDDKGLVTISVEGEIFKIIENTREIVEILKR
jgi:hypothetical protein